MVFKGSHHKRGHFVSGCWMEAIPTEEVENNPRETLANACLLVTQPNPGVVTKICVRRNILS